MGKVSYIDFLVNPKYRAFPFGGIVGWALANRLPTVEDLQEMYDFAYYSSMNAAVTDVNNGTIGTNADATKTTAIAGVYTDQGYPYVVLLKDAAENTSITASVDMTINLGGHTLTFDDTYLGIAGAKNHTDTITIDGRLSGSTIVVNGCDGAGIVLQSRKNNFVVNGGTYILNEKLANDQYSATTIYVNSDGSAVLLDCEIVVNSSVNKARGVISYGTATISNCNIRAYSNYTTGGESYYEAVSQGILNYGSLTINDCNVMGTHSGVQNNGTLYVNGGTYEGYGHGGIYFGTGTATAYVRNATLKDMLTMPDGYEATSSHNGCAFYIGGSSNANNINVYMDNCDLHGSANQGVLRGTSGEKNNSLHISNSRLHDLDGNDIHLRLDGGNHTIYIGTGNNFTEANVEFTDREIDLQNPSHVVVTNEVYVQWASTRNRSAMILGYIIGKRIASQRMKPKGEHVRYLYGHVAKEGEAHTHTINGVDYVGSVLPDIYTVWTPELQKTYPRAIVDEYISSLGDGFCLWTLYAYSEEPVWNTDEYFSPYLKGDVLASYMTNSAENMELLEGSIKEFCGVNEWGKTHIVYTESGLLHVPAGCVWTSHDIYKEDGKTIWLAASDRIPIYE